MSSPQSFSFPFRAQFFIPPIHIHPRYFRLPLTSPTSLSNFGIYISISSTPSLSSEDSIQHFNRSKIFLSLLLFSLFLLHLCLAHSNTPPLYPASDTFSHIYLPLRTSIYDHFISQPSSLSSFHSTHPSKL